MTDTSSAVVSAWAPMRRPVFRMLWITWFVANLCMAMSELAAAWMMTSLTASPVMIALVQTATTAPVFLLGLPSGAAADIVDRRRLYFFTQCWIALTSLILFIVGVRGLLTPGLLLGLTFFNAVGMALRWPVFASIVPDLVPRHELQVAVGMNGVGMNIARIAGPAVAGALLAAFGGAWVFALNAVLSVGAAVMILRWKSQQKASVLPGERFLGAMRVGLRFTVESQPLRVLLLRTGLFFLQSMAVVALLPLIAKRLPDGGPGTFTLLLASMGVGGILAVAALPRLRASVSRPKMMTVAASLHGAATIGMGFAPNLWFAAPAMLVIGAAWLTVVNTLMVSVQMVLPNWIRARGMSMFQVVMMGSSASAAALWGHVAAASDLQWSLLAAAVTGMLAWFAMRKLPSEFDNAIDLTPAQVLAEPEPAIPIEHDQGPVMVQVEFQIDPARADEFAAVMRETRANRLQNGALSWGLFQDLATPGRYIEYFLDESWAQFRRRFERMTAHDIALRSRRNAFDLRPEGPRITRYVAESIKR